MPDMAEGIAASDQIAALTARTAALRQAAGLPGADARTLLEAALSELDAAVDVLAAASASDGGGRPDSSASGLHVERRLLHAVFTVAPVPLYVVDSSGTVLRANVAAADLLGTGPGYATGKSLTSLIEPPARAALRSQLAAASRTGTMARLRCRMLADSGPVPCELAINPVNLRGDADRLLVTVVAGSGQNGSGAGDSAGAAPAAGGATGDGGLAAAVRRLDLLAAATRLLLESATVSESVLLQRCARLLADSLATWVIVDVRRRGQLRRHYVAGPDDQPAARLAHALAGLDPAPGTAPDQVVESGKALLLTHAEDDALLGAGPDGVPLLPLLGAASLLSVPVADGDRWYAVLTLVKTAQAGQFSLPELALAEDVAALLALATSGRRMLRRRTEAAEALRASLLPPVLKPVPGVEIAAAHLTPTRGREEGGDFYDVYPTPGGWGVAIGDVSGTGDDGAAATAAARHAIRVLAHWNPEPAEVLRGANEIMLAEEFGGRFVTASAAHLSFRGDTLRLVLATAGHPGPVLVRPDGRTQSLPGGGVALGIFPDPEPATLELDLDPGDVLFCYTAGLSGVRSASAGYLADNLADSLAALASRPAAEIVSQMRKFVLDFSAGRLVDDLTMLVLRVGRPPAQPV